MSILQIRTRPHDDLAEQTTGQSTPEDCRWEVVDISKAPPDYDTLLDKIFQADAIQVW